MKYKIEGLQAGCLRERIKNINADELSDVKITGELNEDDWKCIYKMTGKKGSTKSLDLSDTIGTEKIDRYNLEEGSILTSIKLPRSLKTLGWGALSMCDKLSTVVIYSGLERIDNYAFNGCSSLKSISLPSTIKTIGNEAFGACSKLEEINIHLANKNYTSFNGVLYTKDGKTLIKYPAGKADTTFVMPSDITKIGENAFFLCENLHHINLSSMLEEIEERAFCSCTALQTLTFPKETKKICKEAFRNCSSLKEIRIEAIVPPIIETNDDENLSLNIYVPLDSADEYRSNEAWNKVGKIYGR